MLKWTIKKQCGCPEIQQSSVCPSSSRCQINRLQLGMRRPQLTWRKSHSDLAEEFDPEIEETLADESCSPKKVVPSFQDSTVFVTGL
jgi:hypothetical protein